MIERLGYENHLEYKESGIDWIEQIPAHWVTIKAKFLLTESSIRSVSGGEDLLSLSKYHGVIRKDQMSERAGQAESLVGYKEVEKDDLVINKMQASNGLMAVSQVTGITSPDYAIYKAKNKGAASTDYICHILRQSEYLAEIKRRAKGVMEGFIRLYTDDLFDLPIILPPLREQQSILAFLDRKCAKIDEAVKIKEDQITLLRERRQIIIQDSVTRGLNPGAPMKDSGIEWIGKIPAHWGVLPLLSVAKVKSLANRPDLELLSVYLDRGVVPFADVEEKRTNTTSLDLSAYQVVDVGDLVLNNQQAWRGSVGVSAFRGIVSPAYIVLALSPDFDSDFANYYFRTGTTVANYLISSKGVGTIQRNLYWPRLKRALIAIPPKSEQISIVEYIRANTQKIDAGIAIKERQITALKEYKSNLINAAVTGKIKVV